MAWDLAFQSDPQSIAGGVSEVELGSEIALCGLDGLVTEGKLDLLERCLARAGELGEGAPEETS